jgi:CheY-like chemotaxis protein
MQVIKAPIRKILLVDNDKDDCFVFETALHEVDPSIELVSLNDGKDVLDYLSTETPDLIFLDLKMPLKSGHECLKELQEHPSFRKIPVIVYSESDYSVDINVSYGLGATLYFPKPNTVNALVKSLERIFGMAWNNPSDITSQYFLDGNYIPFKVD